MTHQERRHRLEELYTEIRKLESECPHSVPHQDEEDKMAICEGCGKCFGWYCPKSPDHICHYYSHNGLIIDVYGNKEIAVPEGYDSRYESSDWCIFCGHPDERK